jgi:hypothetical protein
VASLGFTPFAELGGLCRKNATQVAFFIPGFAVLLSKYFIARPANAKLLAAVSLEA